jgi:hypothetical protein
MTFSVRERVVLLDILQKQSGNIVTIRLVHELQMELGFSEEESQAIGLVSAETGVTWKGDSPKTVHIGPAAKGVIVSALKGLNAMNKLTLAHMDLYNRFVEEE